MDAGTTEIIKRFSKSWMETIIRYEALIDDSFELNSLIPVYHFIQKLKTGGADKNFRLDISMNDIIISRSIELKLRPDQQYIRIAAKGDSFVVTLSDHRKMYRQYTVKELEEERITHLIKTLKGIPID